MSDDESIGPERRREASRWLTIALEDRRVASACIALEMPSFTVAAYLCQQATEKLLKGLLIAAGVPFRKTHDMDELGDLVVIRYPGEVDLVAKVRRLTVWAFAYRYPGIEEIIEPQPTIDELRDVLGVIDALADRLARLTGSPSEPRP